MNKSEIFLNSRILFIIEGCVHCRDYKEFIERLNANLPLNKRIKLIDCTDYYDYGIIEDPLLRIFLPHLSGTFPVLFYNGTKLDGSNSRIETESFLRSLLDNKFIIREENPNLFKKDCIYKLSWFGLKKQLICNE